MALPAILTVATSLISGVQSLAGGSEPGASGACPGQLSSAEIQIVLSRWTAEERAEFERLYLVVSQGQPINYGNLPHLAFSLAGGADCRIGTTAGRQMVNYFMALLSKYRTNNSFAENTLSPAAQIAAAQASQGVGAQIEQIVRNVLNTGKEIVESTVSGAIGGARASTAGASTGAQAGTFAAQNAIPLLGIAAAGALAVLLVVALRK